MGLVGLMLTVSTPIFAQNANSEPKNIVSGVVTDAATGQPLQGVRVQAYNNAMYSVLTKQDGSYSLSLPEHVASLVFMIDGCNTSVCSLKGRTEGVDMKMYSDVFSEVYSRKTVASRAKTIEVESMNADLSVDNQIQQKMQGDIMATIRSGQLGIGASYILNGINSLNINTQPLIVIDGTIVDMGYDRISMHDGFYNNVLSNLMVEDIESVSFLKNGLAVYGAKGANGVILINTKRNKSMATKIDVSIAGNYQFLPKFPEMMDASQYRGYVSELLGTTGTKTSTFKFLQMDKNYLYYNTYHNDTDWSKVSYDNAFVQNYSINVQGGDEIANYNLSVGYAMGDATLKENDFSRFNLRLNSDIVLADKLTMRFDASYSDVTRDLRDDGAVANIDKAMITAPGFLSLVKSPFLSPYAYDNQQRISKYLAGADDYLDEVLGDEASLSNPLAILRNGDGINKNYFGNRLISLSVTPKWDINPHLSLSEHFSYTLINSDENYYTPINGTPSFDVEGIGLVKNKAAASNAKQDGFMSDTYLSYAKRFKAHDVAVQGGVRYLNNSLYQTAMLGYNSGNDKTPNMTNSLEYKDTDGIDSKDISITWWGQGNYNYREKYYLTASLGITASSRFGGDVSNGIKMFKTPWGIFPSVQGAWVASAEPWFAVDFIDYLKLNAGFDLTGNDGFDDSASKTYFTSAKILNMTGLEIGNIGNSSLQWETTKRLTAGLDLAMFESRMFLSANVYSSKTDNLLSISSLSYLTGLPNSWSNGGSLSNKGFDATLSGKIVNNSLVKVEAGASIGKYSTNIDKLPDGKPIDVSYYGATIRTEVGQGIGYFYGYQTDGVFSTSDDAQSSGLYMRSNKGVITKFEAGDVKFVDNDTSDGAGLINEKDMVKIGDATPDFYGRFFANVNVQNFTLSATFNYSVGGDIYNYQRMLLESGSRFMNQTVAMTNHWTCEGQETSVPKIVYGDPHNNARFSDRWIEDGSYLKLKNVTLSYRIPITSTYLQGVTVWAAANNLFTLTKYLGSDPEFSMTNSALTNGIDRGLLPQSRNVSLGVKINL